ncbi:TPA: hypothetical protein ACF3Y6_002901 [Vibrio parahaemolyticus]
MTNVIKAEKVVFEFLCADDSHEFKEIIAKEAEQYKYKVISRYSNKYMWDLIVNNDDVAAVNIYKNSGECPEYLGSVFINAKDEEILGEVHSCELDFEIRKGCHAVLQSVFYTTLCFKVNDDNSNQLLSEYRELGYFMPIFDIDSRIITMMSSGFYLRWGNDVSFDDYGEALELNIEENKRRGKFLDEVA